MSRIARRFASSFVVLALLVPVGVLPMTDAQAAQKREQRVVCNAPKVRLRAEPTKASAIVGQKNQGQTVTGTRTGTWLELGKNQYIAYYYTCPAPEKKATPKKAAPKKATPKKQATKKPAAQKPAANKTAPKNSAATPMRQPTSTNGSTTGQFGNRLHPILRVWRLHDGVDIGNTCNKPIVAATAGTVTFTGKTAGGGNTTVISHGTFNGVRSVQTKYLHQSQMLVKPGQKVKKGQLIGRVGSTGMATVCHLHFGTYENGKAVDPQKYIGPVSKLRNY